MNKEYKMIRYGVLVALLLVASCEPQDFEVPDAGRFSTVFMQSANQNPVTFTFPITDAWSNIPLGAGYGGVNPLTEDLEVTFEINEELVGQFNQQNATHYEIMPEGSYRFSEHAVKIPAGRTGSASINLEVNPLKFNGTKAFILPVSIASTSGDVQINENLRTTYYVVNGVYAENPYDMYAQTDWTIHSFSSDDYDAGGGRAPYAIDSDLTTFWHSQYHLINGTRPGPPHYIAIDMHQERVIHGLEIWGRQDQIGVDGNPRDIVVETSLDGNGWTSAGSFTLENQLASNTIYLEQAVTARYFKLTVTASQKDVYRTHVAEINAF